MPWCWLLKNNIDGPATSIDGWNKVLSSFYFSFHSFLTMEIFTPSSELVTVLINKKSVEEGSRNSVIEYLSDAGYDVLRRKGFDRADRAVQNGIEFKGVKDARGVAFRLGMARQGVGTIIGDDVLLEADFAFRAEAQKRNDTQRDGVMIVDDRSQQANVSSQAQKMQMSIRRVLTLDVGRCRERMLSPKERVLADIAALEDKTIFTKYPETLRTMLAVRGVTRTRIIELTGADVCASDFPETGGFAFDIVESGTTARANGQDTGDALLYPNAAQMGVAAYADFPNIATNLCGVNLEMMSERCLQIFEDFGRGLERSAKCEKAVSFRFCVDEEREKEFAGFGMVGPTSSAVLTREGEKNKRALEICVPLSEQSAMASRLEEMGVQALIVQPDLTTGPKSGYSEVRRAILEIRLASSKA